MHHVVATSKWVHVSSETGQRLRQLTASFHVPNPTLQALMAFFSLTVCYFLTENPEVEGLAVSIWNQFLLLLAEDDFEKCE